MNKSSFMNKKFLTIVLVIALLVGATVGGYFLFRPKVNTQKNYTTLANFNANSYQTQTNTIAESIQNNLSTITFSLLSEEEKCFANIKSTNNVLQNVCTISLFIEDQIYFVKSESRKIISYQKSINSLQSKTETSYIKMVDYYNIHLKDFDFGSQDITLYKAKVVAFYSIYNNFCTNYINFVNKNISYYLNFAPNCVSKNAVSINILQTCNLWSNAYLQYEKTEKSTFMQCTTNANQFENFVNQNKNKLFDATYENNFADYSNFEKIANSFNIINKTEYFKSLCNNTNNIFVSCQINKDDILSYTSNFVLFGNRS